MTADVFNAYDISIVEALVYFCHDSDGFHVKSTWMRATKSGNYTSWPILMADNSTKYSYDSTETKKDYMTQTRQGLCATKLKCNNTTPAPTLKEPLPVHICVEHIRHGLFPHPLSRWKPVHHACLLLRQEHHPSRYLQVQEQLLQEHNDTLPSALPHS